MSRLPVGDATPELDSGLFLCSFLEEIPVGARDICEATRVDPVLSQVLKYILWKCGQDICINPNVS